MKSCGQTIKNLRERHDWPQRKLAYELDVDVAVLSRIENENKFPKKRAFDIIKKAAELLGVEEESLKNCYLSDEIASILEYEENYETILRVCEEKVAYVRNINPQKERDDVSN